MTRTIAGLSLVAVLALASAYTAGQEKEKPGEKKPEAAGEKKEAPKAELPALPKCPVMGNPVNFAVKTMTDQGPVYFCCPMCIPKLEKDPKAYAEKVAAQRAALAKRPRVQVSDPVSGKPIDKKVVLEQKGQKIYFASADDKKTYEADPAKYAAKLADSYTYQTRCPVSGEEIDPAAFSDLPTGQRIYFCCMDCPKELLADPAKFAPKLAEQGMPIDPKAMKEAQGGEKEKAKEGEHAEGGHEGHKH